MSEKPRKDTYGESLKRRVEERADSRRESKLGTGVEKTVYEHPDTAEKTVHIFHPEGVEGPPDYDEDLDEIPGMFIPHGEMDKAERDRYKRQFYLIKILHALFPKNIPDVQTVGTEPRFMIRERIHDTSKFIGGPHGQYRVHNAEETSPLVAELEALGLHIDEHGKNFMSTGEGDYVYPDTFLIDVNQHMSHDENETERIKITRSDEIEIGNRLEAAITHRLEGEDRNIALKRLERYRQLLA